MDVEQVGTGDCGPEPVPARVAANRRNAQRSTGPRTPSGRDKSSRNATKYGLLSRQVTLADEDPAEFRRFERLMFRALGPKGGLEKALAARVAAAAWRLRRFERIEALMLDKGRKDWRGNDVELSSGFIGLCVNGDVFSKLSRYEAGIERAFFRSLHELQRLQAARVGREVSVPEVVEVDVNLREERAEISPRAS